MKVVYTYVVADIIHPGHLLYLQNAKSLGHKLIVGVLTDKAVMEKKPRPIIPFEERLKLVRALRCVDIVFPQDEYSPLKNILMVQPDVLMESESHIGNPYLIELKEKFKGRIIFSPYYPDISSTEIKKRIRGKKKNG